jgi:hypothetical protein
MATFTKVKCINLSTFGTQLTLNGIYSILSITDTTVTITDDLGSTSIFDLALFVPYYEITKLNELLPSTAGGTDGSWTRDSYEVKWRVISATSTQIRLNSIDEDIVETIAITFKSDFGGVTRALAYLTFLGFAINYNQDPLLSFNDRDLFVQFCKTQSWKYSETYEGVRIITDSIGNTVVEELVGLNLVFA